MSKRKIVKNYTGKIPLVDEFKNYIKNGSSTENIISFLSITNARLIGQSAAGISEKLENEVLDFVQYFMENYYLKTESDIYANWPNGPFVFRLADEIIERNTFQNCEIAYADLSNRQKKDVNTLFDKIFNIRAARHISFVDGQSIIELEIPRTIPRCELDFHKAQLKFLCCLLLLNGGAMTIRAIRNQNHTEIFGVRAQKGGLWEPVSKESMIRAHTTMPDGSTIPPEEGVEYTEISKESKIIQFRPV